MPLELEYRPYPQASFWRRRTLSTILDLDFIERWLEKMPCTKMHIKTVFDQFGKEPSQTLKHHFVGRQSFWQPPTAGAWPFRKTKHRCFSFSISTWSVSLLVTISCHFSREFAPKINQIKCFFISPVIIDTGSKTSVTDGKEAHDVIRICIFFYREQ